MEPLTALTIGKPAPLGALSDHFPSFVGGVDFIAGVRRRRLFYLSRPRLLAGRSSACTAAEMLRMKASGSMLALACALCCVMLPSCGGSLAQVQLYRRNSSLDLVAARASRNVAVSYSYNKLCKPAAGAQGA